MAATRHLVAVAGEGGFTQCPLTTCTSSQSTVSASVRGLERGLDAVLLTAPPTAWNLADAGRVTAAERRAQRSAAAQTAGTVTVDAARGRPTPRTSLLGTMPAQRIDDRPRPGAHRVPRRAPGSRGRARRAGARSQWRPRSWKESTLTSRSSATPAIPVAVELRPDHSEPIMLAAPPEHPLRQRRSISSRAYPADPLVQPHEGSGRPRIAVDRSFAAASVTRGITTSRTTPPPWSSTSHNNYASGHAPTSFIDAHRRHHAHTDAGPAHPRFRTAIAVRRKLTGASAPPPRPCSTPWDACAPVCEEQVMTAEHHHCRGAAPGVVTGARCRGPRACQRPSDPDDVPRSESEVAFVLRASSLAAGRSGQSRSKQGRELAPAISPFSALIRLLLTAVCPEQVPRATSQGKQGAPPRHGLRLLTAVNLPRL